MRYYIDPGRKRPSIFFVDDIVYSTVTDMEGKPLELTLSLMFQRERGSEVHPAILWVCGGGYRGVDKNRMVPECVFLAEAGYTVVSVYYRGSGQGHYPAQLIDVKTAVRFLRAHAEQYHIDPQRIGIMGRSAGGQLTAMMAMNTPGFDTEEWSGYSSDVKAAFDMFGPVDFGAQLAFDRHRIEADPKFPWDEIMDTHIGTLFGGEKDSLKERTEAENIEHFINENMAQLLIMHGDADQIVPLSTSVNFYQQLCDAGLEARADFYIVKDAGHGTPEFFQTETRDIVLRFFEKYL